MQYRHTPVMVDEVLGYLDCQPGHICVDCTVGGGGHAAAIIEKLLPDGLLVGIDQDSDAIETAARGLAPYKTNVHLVHDNFVNLPEILAQLDIRAVDGILADLGVSLYQLEASGRGFSFQADEPLDMRMDMSTDMSTDMRMDTQMDSRTDAGASQTAEAIVNEASRAQLKHIFKTYGEEKWAGEIAGKIVRAREKKRIRTTGQLVELIYAAIPGKVLRKRRIHPATKVFMALRIAVNQELEALDAFLNAAVDALRTGGRICVLSFHSLEDRMVKQRFRALENPCTCPRDFPRCACGNTPRLRVLTRKVRRPTEAEVARNPLARSTCLRAAEKL